MTTKVGLLHAHHPVDDASPPRTRRVVRWMGRCGRAAWSGWLVVAILALWELYARVSPSIFFPPITTILRNFGHLWLSSSPGSAFLSHLFWEQAGVSLGRLARGWAIAVLVGIAVGLVLGRSRIAGDMYNPIVRFFTAVPNTALLPVAVQIFGVTDRMNVFLIFIGCVWVIIINTADGVSGVDSMWLRSAQSLRLSRFAFYRSVLIPAAMPRILTGLRVSLGIALILMIISEIYATTAGLGFQIVVAETGFQYVNMWSAFVLVGVIGILLNAIFGLVERRVLHWQRRSGLSEL